MVASSRHSSCHAQARLVAELRYLLGCLLRWAGYFLGLLLSLLEQRKSLATVCGSAYFGGPAKKALAGEQGR